MTPTAVEQEILELINRARMDPVGETSRLVELAWSDPHISSAMQYFNVDLNLFQQQMSSYSAVAPLAWSSALGQAAEAHSQLMIDFQEQSHQLPGEPGLGARVLAAGYDFRTVGENIFAFGENAVQSHAAFVIDWGFGPGGIQSPAGHRETILNPIFTEIGISAIAETDPETSVGPLVVTHNLGADWDDTPYLLGVVFEDQDGDEFYDAGEGMSGVTVTVTGSGGTFSTTSWAAGGYQLAVPDGNYSVTFSGGGFPETVTKTATVSGANVKIDGVLGEVTTGGTPGNDTLTGSSSGDILSSYAGNDFVYGLGGNDELDGGSGNDLIDGGAGIDTAIYSGNQTSYTLTLSPTSTSITDRRADGSGADTLIDIEFLDFDADVLGGPFNLSVFGGPAGLDPVELESFIELYIAYFNRAPDAVGLNFWGTAFATGTSLEEMATLFVDQEETRGTYPDGTSNDTFARSVYDNVLGRTPDDAGIEFWVGQLDTGNVSRDQFILEVLRGAKSELKPELGQAFVDQQLADQAYLSDKVDIGAYFAVHKGMSDVDNASAAMAHFDGTEVSVDAAVAAIDTFYAEALDPTTGEFLMPVVGVLDDPFAVA